MFIKWDSDDERFWSKVDVIEDPTACWLWNASTKEGYGQFMIKKNGKWVPELSHRISYEQFYGKIPDNLHIDHLCRTRLCVNPNHLEAVTPAENCLRQPLGRNELGQFTSLEDE